MKAKEYLLAFSKCDIDIKNIENEIKTWRSFGERDFLRKARNRLKEKREIRSDIYYKILKDLDKLEQTEREILEMRFIGIDKDGSGKRQTMTLQEIANHYKKAYTWVTTTQGRALKHLQQIIDRGEIHE